jgi:hypothetical protein
MLNKRSGGAEREGKIGGTATWGFRDLLSKYLGEFPIDQFTEYLADTLLPVLR